MISGIILRPSNRMFLTDTREKLSAVLLISSYMKTQRLELSCFSLYLNNIKRQSRYFYFWKNIMSFTGDAEYAYY
jgi:hypothetical protein